jgi:urease accessory protein
MVAPCSRSASVKRTTSSRSPIGCLISWRPTERARWSARIRDRWRHTTTLAGSTRSTKATPTPIEITASLLDDRTILSRLAGNDLLRPRPLSSVDGTARVALVQPSASLLRGDELIVQVDLGPGARLELLDVAAMVVQPTRGGPLASLRIMIRLGPNAALEWDARPLVLCEGCELRRAITIEIEVGAAVLLRDTLVFGRAAEQPGVFKTRTVVAYDGAPLHHEALDTSGVDAFRSEAVLGQARVLDTVAIYGARRQGHGVLQLAGPGSMLMVAAPDAADAQKVVDSTFCKWRLQPGSAGP